MATNAFPLAVARRCSGQPEEWRPSPQGLDHAEAVTWSWNMVILPTASYVSCGFTSMSGLLKEILEGSFKKNAGPQKALTSGSVGQY